MAAIPELPQPGVEVIQEFTDQTPVVVVPTLVPCVVGVCKEIRELYASDGTLNSDILVDGPAIAVAESDESSYTSMDGLTLQVRITGGVIQTFTMPTGASPPTDMTAQEVAIAINGHSPPPVNFAAYVFTDDAGDKYLELRTLADGEDRTIQIVGGTAVSKFGWGVGYTFYGLGNYIQDDVYLKQASFPDPRGNLEELDIDEDSIRVFLDLSTEIREILQDQSFLRRGTYSPDPNYGAVADDDSDGDQTTPYVDLNDGGTTQNLLASPSAAEVTGTVDLSTAQYLHNKTLVAQIDGGGIQTVQFVGNPVISEAVSGLFPFTGNFTITVNGQTGIEVNISAAADLTDLVDQVNADAQVVALGVGNIAFASDADGNAGATNLGLLVGGAPTTPVNNTEVIVTGETTNDLFLTASLPYRQLIGNSDAGPQEDIADQINAVFPSTVASYDASNYIVVSGGGLGDESKVEIHSASSGLTELGLSAGITNGGPFAVRQGDALYGDGVFLGNIIEVHPGATTGRVKLDREISATGKWTSWYIVAQNLDTVASNQYGVTVPTPDFILDTNGDVRIKQDFLRDTTGAPIIQTGVPIYVAYEALRLDVTADAAEPSMLSFGSTDDLEDAIGPIVPENPLAYGIFQALQNAGTATVYGIGVGAVTDDKPYGTITAWSEAFDFLKAEEVYAIAPMTTDLEVALLGQTHVNAMSAASMKGERILITHLGRPTRKVDTLVASGNDGDSVAGGPPYYFDTKIATLSQALLDADIDPTSITIDDGVFLDIGSDAFNWNIVGSVTEGTKVTINTTFATGQNDDGFYQEDASEWSSQMPIISDSFSIKIRGSVVANLDEEVETVYYRGQGFLDRRVWMVQLDQAAATVNGVEQLVPGFYVCAAKAGQVAGLPPSQPLTNYPIAGFTRVTGTNDRYNTEQLNKMAAGGADLIVQIAQGAPVHSRMQVTTDLTSIEKREQSIVKALDFAAKFYRVSMRIYIGRFNITQSFIDTLGTVAQGLGRWLVEQGKVLKGAELNNLLQDDNQPDTVLVDVTVEVLYPCNYIRITLLI